MKMNTSKKAESRGESKVQVSHHLNVIMSPS
jgi:hypothetical protein